MLTLVALLAACEPSTIVVSHQQPGCEDYDFENPPAEEVVLVEQPLALQVSHVGVIEACDALFEPDIEADGRVITVREYWTDDAEGDCETCYSPTITLKAPPSGRYEFRWYVGDAEAPLGTVSVKVD